MIFVGFFTIYATPIQAQDNHQNNKQATISTSFLKAYETKDNSLTMKTLPIEDTCETPEEAYQETMRALKLVSRKLNKGSVTTIKTVRGAGSFTKILKKKKLK